MLHPFFMCLVISVIPPCADDFLWWYMHTFLCWVCSLVDHELNDLVNPLLSLLRVKLAHVFLYWTVMCVSHTAPLSHGELVYWTERLKWWPDKMFDSEFWILKRVLFEISSLYSDTVHGWMWYIICSARLFAAHSTRKTGSLWLQNRRTVPPCLFPMSQDIEVDHVLLRNFWLDDVTGVYNLCVLDNSRTERFWFIWLH